MDLILKTDYWNDPKSREAFKRFIKRIHNLDFTTWETAGFWDNQYTPFSYFKGDELISNICIYLLDAVIHDRKTRIAQISGVGTDPLFRRQGLNRKLTRMALEWAEDKSDNGFFLFADEEAIPYYKACGFTPIIEHVEWIEAPKTNKEEGLFKLSPDHPQDFKKIITYVDAGIPASDTFSILNKNLLMFNVLYSMKEQLYEIPDLECLVWFKRRNGCLYIHDIIGRKIPTFRELYPYMTDARDIRVEFHFHTDKLGIKNIKSKPKENSGGFVKGPFPFQKPVFPANSYA